MNNNIFEKPLKDFPTLTEVKLGTVDNDWISKDILDEPPKDKIKFSTIQIPTKEVFQKGSYKRGTCSGISNALVQKYLINNGIVTGRFTVKVLD